MTLEAMVDLLEQGNDHEGIAFLCTIPGQEHCPCGMDAQMTSVLHQIGVHVMESPADSLENSSSTLQVISPSVSKIKTPSDK
ncbi:MAG: hypothetical protein OEV94_03830 [Deltaproteobacteria bacterium]|nr:hypothetical protein [Deltaproteobacteria bacterium]